MTIFYPQGVDSVKVNGQWKVDSIYHTITPFKFTNQNNKEVSNKDVKGKIYVADFFFTRCGSICPKMTSQLTRVQNAFKDNKEINILSFSIDPEHDSVEVLKNYADQYKAISGQWHFLTGNKHEIYNLGVKGFKIPVGDEGQEVTPDYFHSSRLILVDHKGRIRGYYNGVSRDEVDKLILEIKVLLQEYKD
ncbi:SCO family protein [Microscilla marina]|uniref:Chain A, Identification Of A Disulfide Switch In Bssco, A Member Of The Sco Family Of Cytochrome C Oxidase Assembly Proteins n=1 Tax=Microscilla marina ATCC 23134 TaxID=313606 RepID=A1ZL82_MICM2|nr:SCO family protein [Microscilla marina]EAY29048.1 chain A, Identification Of A Disulfide Switch In Bssco, A Member Of The Sco Family Of Cytochrome C Oxidase Assembly Proteins [Microscilla marina ATCC 23134]